MCLHVGAANHNLYVCFKVCGLNLKICTTALSKTQLSASNDVTKTVPLSGSLISKLSEVAHRLNSALDCIQRVTKPHGSSSITKTLSWTRLYQVHLLLYLMCQDCHVSPIKCHLSHATGPLSPVICHQAPVTGQLSPVTCHLPCLRSKQC